MELFSLHKSYILKANADQAYFQKQKKGSTKWILKGVDHIHWSDKENPAQEGTIGKRKLVSAWKSLYQHAGTKVAVKYKSNNGKSLLSRFTVTRPHLNKQDRTLSFVVGSDNDNHFPWKGNYKKIKNKTLDDPIINFSPSRWMPKGWFDHKNPDNIVGGAIKDYRNQNFKNANLSGGDFREADLRGVNFKNANLYLADFIGANLKGAKFKGALWRQTSCKDGTLNEWYLPCSRSQMSNNPIWHEDPDYFDKFFNDPIAEV